MASKIVKTYEEQPVGPSKTDYAAEFSKTPWSAFQDFRAKQYQVVNLDNEKYLFLYNINNREEFKIKVIPDSLSESYSQKIVSQTPYGVIHPINFYVGGNSKELSFTFDLHEDILDNILSSKTLYDLLDDLESMMKPKIINQVFKEPLVYFQLGNQFAGLGHIEVNYDFKKPFRNGRYTMASISIQFTFHEEFDAQPPSFQTTLFSDVFVGPEIDLTDWSKEYESIEDLKLSSLDYDYIVSSIYSDSKVTTFFNTVTSGIESRYDEIGFGEEAEEYVEAIQSGEFVSSHWIINSNPFTSALIESFFRFKSIINPVFSTVNIVDNLERLRNELNNLEWEYNSSYHPTDSTKTGNGWYIKRTLYNYADIQELIVQMSEVEKEAFEEALSYLQKVVDAQIDLYSMMTGAGE